MARRKILTVVGARPQFIKAAPVSRAIAAAGELDEVMVHTGQHFDHGMSDVFFEELGIPQPRLCPWNSRGRPRCDDRTNDDRARRGGRRLKSLTQC